MNNHIETVVIIGSGPAGHTAAIYAARANLNPLMFEGFMAAGVAAGGQLTTTTEIENFPGFVSIGGPELMHHMREQAIHCGARIRTETVAKVDLSQRPFKVFSEEGDVILAKTLIIATGATAKRMRVPREEEFWQKGISACAVCDGALPLFRNQPLVVIGGGDTAVEEATYLTKFASKVYMIHRRDELRASKAMQQRAFSNPHLEIVWDTGLEDVFGDKFLEGVKLKNLKTGEEKSMEAKGLFYAIGHTPNTAFLEGQLKTDESGYIITTPGSTLTSVPGVFAAGDVQDKRYRQAVTSAGTGCMAALDAEHFLASEAHGGH
ncbi:MAG TPA: thioredoxin-disulfide reductase [Fibrobacteres bacterium]|jgi:thioredoxin reductase (NADPH)|nr:thioredoxin-disulfide reductase [Fibrobacterota bacterium]